MKGLLICFLFILQNAGFTQTSLQKSLANPSTWKQTDTLSKKKQNRQIIAASVQGTLITGSMILLDRYWYADNPKQRLASFNDSKEWKQMDKFGHVFSSYLEARTSTTFWKWAGVPPKKSLVLGVVTATAYQTGFEILDGLSAEYGFSWSDIAANTFGAGVFIGQELLWNEQRIQPKFSYSKQHYAPELSARIEKLYGKSGTQRFLKDYNGQTYWLSFNMRAFVKKSNLPKWLNIAVGIGAEGLLGGFENKWKDGTNNTVTRFDILRKRQFYLAPDIDFSKIKTKKKGVKVLLHVLNLFKFPAPGLVVTGGKLQWKAIAY